MRKQRIGEMRIAATQKRKKRNSLEMKKRRRQESVYRPVGLGVVFITQGLKRAGKGVEKGLNLENSCMP